MEKSPVNHGEGNPDAAETFNQAERAFVASERGKGKIKEGAQIEADEKSSLEQAEQRGKSRAKHDDSNTEAMKSKR